MLKETETDNMVAIYRCKRPVKDAGTLCHLGNPKCQWPKGPYLWKEASNSASLMFATPRVEDFHPKWR